MMQVFERWKLTLHFNGISGTPENPFDPVLLESLARLFGVPWTRFADETLMEFISGFLDVDVRRAQAEAEADRNRQRAQAAAQRAR